MKVSRRGFIGSAIKGAALVALAPLISKLPEAKAEEPKEVVTANDVPEIEGSDCANYTAQVTIRDYVPGAKIRYQDLTGEPDCRTCLYDDIGSCDTIIDPVTFKNVRRGYRGIA